MHGSPPQMRFGMNGNTDSFSYCWLCFSDWRGCTEKHVARKRAEIRITSWTTEIDQTLLQLWFLEGILAKDISSDFVPHMEEDFLDCETKIWSQSERWNEGSRCERSHMRHIMSATLKAAIHLGIDYTENLQSSKNQSRNLWDNCFKWLRSWSLTKMKLLITTIGWRQLMWTETTLLMAELFNLQFPKPAFFPTQCYVWEVSILIQSKHGTTR